MQNWANKKPGFGLKPGFCYVKIRADDRAPFSEQVMGLGGFVGQGPASCLPNVRQPQGIALHWVSTPEFPKIPSYLIPLP
jgi:hypothetical protein